MWVTSRPPLRQMSSGRSITSTSQIRPSVIAARRGHVGPRGVRGPSGTFTASELHVADGTRLTLGTYGNANDAGTASTPCAPISHIPGPYDPLAARARCAQTAEPGRRPQRPRTSSVNRHISGRVPGQIMFRVELSQARSSRSYEEIHAMRPSARRLTGRRPTPVGAARAGWAPVGSRSRWRRRIGRAGAWRRQCVRRWAVCGGATAF